MALLFPPWRGSRHLFKPSYARTRLQPTCRHSEFPGLRTALALALLTTVRREAGGCSEQRSPLATLKV